MIDGITSDEIATAASEPCTRPQGSRLSQIPGLSFREADSPGRNPKFVTTGELGGGLVFRALK